MVLIKVKTFVTVKSDLICKTEGHQFTLSSNVLVLLRDDLILNLCCSICSTPDKSQNKSTCKSNVLNKLF